MAIRRLRLFLAAGLCLFATSATAQNRFVGLNAVDPEYTDPYLRHAIDVISSTYGDLVSVTNKKKDLLKFGTHTCIGTGWETLAEMQVAVRCNAANVDVAGGFNGKLAIVVQ